MSARELVRRWRQMRADDRAAYAARVRREDPQLARRLGWLA